MRIVLVIVGNPPPILLLLLLLPLLQGFRGWEPLPTVIGCRWPRGQGHLPC